MASDKTRDCDSAGLRGIIRTSESTGLDMTRQLLVLIFAIALPISSTAADQDPGKRDPTTLWSTWGGAGQFELRGDYLPDYGLEIVVDGRAADDVIEDKVGVRNLGSLKLHAPAGNFAGFVDGRLELVTGIVLRHAGREVSLKQLVAIPGVSRENSHPVLRLSDGQGRHLLTLDHLHIAADAGNQLLTIHNADVTATAMLAKLLDLPVIEGTPLGMAWLDLNLHVPPDADTSGIGRDDAQRGLSCAGRPFWPQDGNQVDVELIGIGTVAYQGKTGEAKPRVKVAPSATLKNVSAGDAVWVPKFSQIGQYTFEPRDQHPFLVWNMYRIADGRIEQLGGSGVKHAFLTLNFNCTIDCGSNNILWPGCEDVYSSGTNNSNANQGPRGDIDPAGGLFFSTCSFFDPGCVGNQTNNSSTFENRLMVDEAELDTPDAQYFLDSWYVVQHDVDIFNSMGYHPITPTEIGTGWSFSTEPFVSGAAVEEWVAVNDPDPLADHVEISVASETPGAAYPDNQPQGHLRVLARAVEIAPGIWRYNYAAMNLDFSRNIDRIDIPFDAGATLLQSEFRSPVVDGVAGDPWTISRSGNTLSFVAPANNTLRWFSLYNFEIETSVPPADRPGTLVLHAAEDGSPSTLSANLVVPGLGEAIFVDGFEQTSR